MKLEFKCLSVTRAENFEQVVLVQEDEKGKPVNSLKLVITNEEMFKTFIPGKKFCLSIDQIPEK